MKIHFLLVLVCFLNNYGSDASGSKSFKDRLYDYYKKAIDLIKGPDILKQIEDLNNKNSNTLLQEYDRIKFLQQDDPSFRLSDMKNIAGQIEENLRFQTEDEKTDSEMAKAFIKNFASVYQKYYEDVIATFAIKHKNCFLDLLRITKKLFFNLQNKRDYDSNQKSWKEFIVQWNAASLSTDQLFFKLDKFIETKENFDFEYKLTEDIYDNPKFHFDYVYGLGTERVIFLGTIINTYIKDAFSKALQIDFSIKDEKKFLSTIERNTVNFLYSKMFGKQNNKELDSLYKMNYEFLVLISMTRLLCLTLRKTFIKELLLKNVHFEDSSEDNLKKNPKLIPAVKKIMEVYPATFNEVVIDAFLAGNKSYDLFSDYISQVIENKIFQPDVPQSEKNIFVAVFLEDSLFKNASSYTKNIDSEALYFFRKGIGYLGNQAEEFKKLIERYFSKDVKKSLKK